MKFKTLLSLLAVFALISNAGFAQVLEPEITFKEDPGTHNIHLCSDGKFLYTCNGGVTEKGKIFKYDKKGNFIEEYKITLDMRGIMYNRSDDHFYVNCYNRNIYRVDYLDTIDSKFTLVHEGLYGNEQAGLALDKRGEKLFFLDNGTLFVFDFKTGEELETYSDIRCGSSDFTGGAVVAWGKNMIYTWDSEKQEVYVYDKKMRLKRTVKVKNGNYAFSLSFGKKLVYISVDGNYKTGTWYGYKIK